jgi:hypothetical protein
VPLRQGKDEMNMPGLPVGVVEMMAPLPPGEVCGRCISMKEKARWCSERNIHVQPADPGCPWFVRAE